MLQLLFQFSNVSWYLHLHILPLHYQHIIYLNKQIFIAQNHLTTQKKSVTLPLLYAMMKQIQYHQILLDFFLDLFPVSSIHIMIYLFKYWECPYFIFLFQKKEDFLTGYYIVKGYFQVLQKLKHFVDCKYVYMPKH